MPRVGQKVPPKAISQPRARGIYNRAFGRFFVWSTTILDSSIVTPVDTDADGSVLAQARAERGGSSVGQTMTDALWRAFPFRDSEVARGLPLWEFASAYPLLDQINAAGVAVYLVAGWYDLFTRDVFLLYRNLTVPKRLLVRPLDHSRIDATAPDLDYGAEVQRWFDHWLKGIDNGIMDESAVHYYLLGDTRADRWQAARQWPPEDPQPQLTLYPGTGRLLTSAPPAAATGSDAYTVDYGTTTGKDTRWTAVNWEHAYGDLAAHDARAISYTGAPLQAPLRAVGHPVAHLWLSTAAPDLDIFTYLEQVDGRGRSTYITEGALRATHRGAAEPPYDNLGLPYHDHQQSHLTAIPAAEPFEVHESVRVRIIICRHRGSLSSAEPDANRRCARPSRAERAFGRSGLSPAGGLADHNWALARRYRLALVTECHSVLGPISRGSLNRNS